MEPFLLSVVSDSDLWMWVSSTGALTAGRVDTDGALFPYYPDDHLHQLAGLSGPVTVIVRRRPDGSREVWQPFAPRVRAGVERSLAKHHLGNRIILEETYAPWGGVVFRTSWSPSQTYGWVRESELIDTRQNGDRMALEVMDGLVDIMPPGISADLERSVSNLANAYKRSETGVWDRVGTYSLEALITDRAEPAEAMSATVVWSTPTSAGSGGLTTLTLDPRALQGMFDGGEGGVPAGAGASPLVGRPGAYLLSGTLVLDANTRAHTWMIAADVNVGRGDLFARVEKLQSSDAVQGILADVQSGRERLAGLLGGADGMQDTGDALADAHHLSNTLFNCMRGGAFPYGYRVPVADLANFFETRNRSCYERQRGRLEKLGQWVERGALLEQVRGQWDDADAVRLVLEYLPLTFSRRHGDPSRPWNMFTIKVKNDDGSELLNYQGNWRDIFQNWEALLYSFPEYLPNVAAKFVNATTINGYNPYRVTRDGVEWEEYDPHDPWSNIGYWGDHQIIYLLRILEAWERFYPGDILGWLQARLFSFSDVPYKIANYPDMVRDPRNTITHDHERAEVVHERMRQVGTDGRLLAGADGGVLCVGLLEKLLIPALAKVGAYVPHGGIWMNTQRPEWNDANNALAGYGLSMVTLYYLRRYIGYVSALIERFAAGAGGGTVDSLPMSQGVIEWLSGQTETLKKFENLASADSVDPGERREFMDSMGGVEDRYKARVSEAFAAPGSGGEWKTGTAQVQGLLQWCQLVSVHLDASIQSARRPDGLFHSYNLIDFAPISGKPAAQVSHLEPMLEGQVAVLASGVLGSQGGVELVDALYASELYRADQNTFILYPARVPAPFHLRGSVSAEQVAGIAALQGGGGADDVLGAVLTRGSKNDDKMYFAPNLSNAEAVETALDHTQATPEQRVAILELYEKTFNHHAYSGRSGSMHGYEGIGSVYWHMVGKLQLALSELYLHEISRGDSADKAAALELAKCYRRVRDGLGFRKTPGQFGAVPTDCYSHTPAHAGAQQPGMTGQVKESILARLNETGVCVANGIVSVRLGLLGVRELFGDRKVGEAIHISFCNTPLDLIRIEGTETERVEIKWKDKPTTQREGAALTGEESRELFSRTGAVTWVRFYIHA